MTNVFKKWSLKNELVLNTGNFYQLYSSLRFLQILWPTFQMKYKKLLFFIVNLFVFVDTKQSFNTLKCVAKTTPYRKNTVYSSYNRRYAKLNNISSVRAPIMEFNYANTTLLFQYWVELHTAIPSNFNRPLKAHDTLLVKPWCNYGSVINTGALLSRWRDAFNLFYTLFFYKESATVFSSTVFVEETTLLNKTGLNLSSNLFRHLQPTLFLNGPAYGLESLLAFTKLKSSSFDISVITDIKIHEKTCFFLRLLNSYTIALTPTNYNPWLFSYPIPTAVDSFLTQYFFFKWLFMIRALSLQDAFVKTRSYWESVTAH